MTAIAPLSGVRQHKLLWAIQDNITITWRNLIAYTRTPEAVVFSTIQPIMFVLLFRYVFSGSISHVVQGPYIEFLMPGVFVQTISFGAVSTAIGLADDLHKGLIERFRALPMARSAVLGGRTFADLGRNVVVTIIITGVGYAVGYRIGTNVIAYIGGLAILLLFSFTLSWGFAYIGLTSPNAETAQVMSFPVLFPLIFAAPSFVPVNTFPGWLQAFARHQPVGVVVTAARAMMDGGPTVRPVLYALAWCVGLLAVFVPLGVWRYRKAT